MPGIGTIHGFRASTQASATCAGVARGELVTVLEEFSTPFPGFYLYYPQRRHASPALRALIDFLRSARRTRRGSRR